MMTKTQRGAGRYLNPYLGGVLLGLVLLAANFVSGRGLGASGAIKSVVATTIETVDKDAVNTMPFMAEYARITQRQPDEIMAGLRDAWRYSGRLSLRSHCRTAEAEG
ncbi:MAG: hypothetical protein MZV63_40400 [Marinilabiliales bacterium]|nr:hypothetical protein [Marinilabiliales bacterium]